MKTAVSVPDDLFAQANRLARRSRRSRSEVYSAAPPRIVQGAVDRRFNRARYAAERIVDTFAAALREETDLGQIDGGIVDALASSLGLSSVTVWKRQSR